MNEYLELTWHDLQTGERVVVRAENPSPVWWRNVKTGDEISLPVVKVQHFRAEDR